jgi:hypothetical protein
MASKGKKIRNSGNEEEKNFDSTERIFINFRILGALREFIQFIGRDAWTGVDIENVKWNCAIQLAGCLYPAG